MAVQVTTLDILIERGRFEPHVARAIGDAIAAETGTMSSELATKQDLTEVKSQLVEVKSQLEVKIADSKSDVIRWMFTALIGQTAVTLGAMYFMLRALD
jgi:hypothetical protein